MLGSRSIRLSLSRRRPGPPGRSPRGERGYAFELAALHLELLVAMAAADGQVQPPEVEAVMSFIDEAALHPEDMARLEAHAKVVLHQPPSLDVLLARLSPLAQRPTLAARLVRDLTRVAHADAHTDASESRMLDAACAALGVRRPQLQTTEDQASRAAVRDARDRAASLVTQRRARAAVRDALEASYRERGA